MCKIITKILALYYTNVLYLHKQINQNAMTTFKSNVEQVSEILDRKNVKEIKEMFHNEAGNYSVYSDNADLIAEFITENSNDFTKDIATRIRESEGKFNTSAKQAWCLAYQVVNNIEVYKLANKNY